MPGDPSQALGLVKLCIFPFPDLSGNSTMAGVDSVESCLYRDNICRVQNYLVVLYCI